ncbi:MAG: DMT family transporter [Lachnospiraceae bacterium]|nr:DMT family transporter [Lachnospiraceae bacterium]
MSRESKGLLAALLSNIIFGLSFLFSRLAFDVALPSVLLAMRFLVAFIILNIMIIVRHLEFSPKGKPIAILLAVGLTQPIIYFICESYGIMLTSSSFAGIIISLIPISTMFLGVIFLKEQATTFQVFCAIISVVGVALTTFGSKMGSVSFPGILFLLGAVLSAAAFNVLSRKAAVYFHPLEKTYVMLALGTIIFTAMAIFQCRNDFINMVIIPLKNTKFWVSVFYLSVISSVLAFMLLNYSFIAVSAGRVAIFANITTVISIMAGVFILKESFTIYQGIGSAIIIGGVYGVNHPPKPINGKTLH